jgi:hypothetical protein
MDAIVHHPVIRPLGPDGQSVQLAGQADGELAFAPAHNFGNPADESPAFGSGNQAPLQHCLPGALNRGCCVLRRSLRNLANSSAVDGEWQSRSPVMSYQASVTGVKCVVFAKSVCEEGVERDVFLTHEASRDGKFVFAKEVNDYACRGGCG